MKPIFTYSCLSSRVAMLPLCVEGKTFINYQMNYSPFDRRQIARNALKEAQLILVCTMLNLKY